MYYPKSQIQTNLYTKGKEYYVESTKQDYKGYYYILSNNTFFTGKTPQDPEGGNKLIKYIVPPSPLEITSPTNPLSKNVYSTIEDPSYNNVKNLTPSQKLYSLPTYYYPKPIDQDYKIGEFERYFLSKINETKFIETNKLTYNRYLNQDPSVAYQLYIPIKLSWVLTGKKEEVYKVNIRTVERTQSNLGLRGFVQYFKGRFTQFYK